VEHRRQGRARRADCDPVTLFSADSIVEQKRIGTEDDVIGIEQKPAAQHLAEFFRVKVRGIL